jgi:hypothetical protein
MKWRLAPALEALRKQLDDMYPKRSKASDGTIGDLAHASRQSDHNPDTRGIVAAMDITHDPRHNLDGLLLAEQLICDKRVKYVIFNRRIRYPGKEWQPYAGTNPHDKHLHVSVKADCYEDPREWDIKEDEMITKNGLNVAWRFRLGIAPKKGDYDKFVGKMTFDEADKAIQKLPEYKARQKVVKQAKELINSHLPKEMR